MQLGEITMDRRNPHAVRKSALHLVRYRLFIFAAVGNAADYDALSP